MEFTWCVCVCVKLMRCAGNRRRSVKISHDAEEREQVNGIRVTCSRCSSRLHAGAKSSDRDLIFLFGKIFPLSRLVSIYLMFSLPLVNFVLNAGNYRLTWNENQRNDSSKWDTSNMNNNNSNCPRQAGLCSSAIWNRLTNCINLMSTEPPNLMGHLPFSHKTPC